MSYRGSIALSRNTREQKQENKNGLVMDLPYPAGSKWGGVIESKNSKGNREQGSSEQGRVLDGFSDINCHLLVCLFFCLFALCSARIQFALRKSMPRR